MSFKQGLEALEEEVVDPIEGDEDVPQNQEEILEDIVEVGEDEDEVVEVMEEVEDMDDAEGEFEEATEQLIQLQTSIEQYGLCKAQISALNDPDGYLVASGILPAFESLNDLPTKNEVSTASVEAISEALKNGWEKFLKFITTMWEKLKNLFKKFFDIFRSYDKILKGLSANIGSGKFDDAKLNEINTTVPMASSLDALNKANATMANSLNASDSFNQKLSAFNAKVKTLMASNPKQEDVDKAIEEIEKEFGDFCKTINTGKSVGLGVTINEKAGKFSISTFTPEKLKNGTKESLAKKGWKNANIKIMVGEAIKTASYAGKLAASVDKLDKDYAAMKTSVKDFVANKVKDPIHVNMIQKALNAQKAIIKGKKDVLKRCVANSNGIMKATISAARQALPALK